MTQDRFLFHSSRGSHLPLVPLPPTLLPYPHSQMLTLLPILLRLLRQSEKIFHRFPPPQLSPPQYLHPHTLLLCILLSRISFWLHRFFFPYYLSIFYINFCSNLQYFFFLLSLYAHHCLVS